MSLNDFVHLDCLLCSFIQEKGLEDCPIFSGGRKKINPFPSYRSIFSSKFIRFSPEVQHTAVGSVFFNGKWTKGNGCFSNISNLSRIDLFFFFFLLWIKCLDENCLSGEKEHVLQGWGASLLHECIWQHWMIQMICLSYPAGPSCTVRRGRENEQKKMLLHPMWAQEQGECELARK